MKKKLFALLVALGMVTMLIGCGNGAELEYAQDQITNLRNELADLEDVYDELAQNMAALQAENDALQSLIEALQSDVDVLLHSNDAYLDEILAIEAEFFQLLEEHLELLELLGDDFDDEDEDEHDSADSENNNQTSDSATLVGTWLWAGTTYYVFNEDGTGTMVGEDILWTASNGILIVCTTPDLCEDTDSCLIPQEWYYEIDGDELTLDSRQLANFSFTYTRR